MSEKPSDAKPDLAAAVRNLGHQARESANATLTPHAKAFGDAVKPRLPDLRRIMPYVVLAAVIMGLLGIILG